MNSKPRILHVIDNTVSGGAQSQLESIIQGLRGEYSFSVAVLGRSGKYSDIYRSLGVEVHQINKGDSRSNVTSFPALMKFIRREKPDLIHAHLFKSMIFSALAAKLANIKCILHDHSGLDADSLKFYFPNFVSRCLYSLAFRLAVRSSVRLLVLTPGIRDGYIRYFHAREDMVNVLPNSIDRERFHTIEPGSLRTELGLAHDCKMIVMVGRLAPEKDWPTFLEIARMFPDPARYAFIAVGSGGLEKNLLKFVHGNDLKNVHFLGERQDVPSILKEGDAFLLTSRFEAFGNVILEAMAADCPVIATRTAGPASIIQPESNGLLVEVGDVDGFVTCIERVLSDASLSARLVCNANVSLKQFDLPVVSKRLTEIYTQVLQERDEVAMIEPAVPARTLKKRIWNATKIILAILLIGYVISLTDVQQLKLTWETILPGWLLLSVAGFFLMTIIKALQYRALINPQLSFWNVLNIIVMQNAISNFISNTAGVVSYFSMFREEHGVKISRSAVVFVIVKVGDLAAILVILVSSLVFVWSRVSPLHGLLLLLSIGIFLALGIFFGVVIFRQWFVGILRKIMTRMRLMRFSPVQSAFTTFESISTQDQGQLLHLVFRSVFYSSIYFACTLIWSYSVVHTFQLPIDLPGILFVSALRQIISFIPIQVFGGLGVTEISAMYLYGLFGIPVPMLSAALLGMRIYTTLLNGLTLLYIPFGRSRS